MKPKLFDEWNKKELQESDKNYKALYAIISVVSTNDIKYIFEFKSSKEAWAYLESKYRYGLSSVLEDRPVCFEIGSSGCSSLIVSHSKVFSSRSTY